MKISPDVLDKIGNTPLVALPLEQIRADYGIDPAFQFYAKLESLNPSGSVKDRMAKHILACAERDGMIKPGGIVVENSSGNTGAALAMICAIKGYRCIITMPDKMSFEKQRLMKSYGAEVVIAETDVPADSPKSYYSLARKIASEIEGAYYPDQYNNPENIEAHYLTTGPEIFQQMQGTLDVLVAGAGTGGTISGAGRYLKTQDIGVKIVAVDPKGSVFYDYFKEQKLIQPKVYQVEGIGEDYLVKALDFSIIDDMVQVNDRESFILTRRLAREEGLFVGGSSGAALFGALQYAKKLQATGLHKFLKERKRNNLNFVIIFPDSGDRYLSKIYDDSWMLSHGYLQ